MRADRRMKTVQSSVNALANQQRVPEALAPPVQGTNELRMHVDDTVSRILGQHGQQFTQQLGQHLGGMSAEMVRNMREHNGHLSEMLRHLARGQQQHQRQQQTMMALTNGGGAPPPPPGAGAATVNAAPPVQPEVFRFGEQAETDGSAPEPSKTKIQPRVLKPQARLQDAGAVTGSIQAMGRAAALLKRRTLPIQEQASASASASSGG